MDFKYVTKICPPPAQRSRDTAQGFFTVQMNTKCAVITEFLQL